MELPAKNGLGSANVLRVCLDGQEVETRPGNTYPKHVRARTVAGAA